MTGDPLDDLGSAELGESGLGALLRDLTSPGLPEELGGLDAAMAMFADVNAARAQTQAIGITQSSAPHHPPRRTAVHGHSPPSRRPPARRPLPQGQGRRRARVGGRLVAVASFLALAFGFAAAGYAEVLPAPLQRVAYQILGFAGVPDSPGAGSHSVPQTSGSHGRGGHASSHPTTVGSVTPTPGSGPGTGSGSPGHKHSRSGSPSPTGSPSPPVPPAQITIAAAQTQIVAGSSVRITASLTAGGQPEPDVTLNLTELAAGQAVWRQVAQAKTGSAGQLALTVPALRTNASFRFTGPHGALSGQLAIVVVPTVTVTVTHGHGHSDLLLVTSALAQRRDVVELEVSAGGSWQVVHRHRLRQGNQTAFSVAIKKTSPTYRVVLLATLLHGQSVSNSVTVANGPRHGGGNQQ